METSSNGRDSKENLFHTNGNRPPLISRLDRSISKNKEDNDIHIIQSNTTTNLTEQAKPDELATGLATMGLLNDDDMNKVKFISIIEKYSCFILA
jgi:hypothetical protein